jgi:transposase
MVLLALSAQERGILQEVLASLALTNAARRAQALLWLDARQSPETVAARLGVSRQTVYNWATRFKERRGQCDVPARLADDKRSGRRKTTARVIDPLITAVLGRDPHEFGYCAPKWTPTLLERYLRQVHNVSVCRRSVSLALQRLEPQQQTTHTQSLFRHDLEHTAAHPLHVGSGETSTSAGEQG